MKNNTTKMIAMSFYQVHKSNYFIYDLKTYCFTNYATESGTI